MTTPIYNNAKIAGAAATAATEKTPSNKIFRTVRQINTHTHTHTHTDTDTHAHTHKGARTVRRIRRRIRRGGLLFCTKHKEEMCKGRKER